MQFRLVKPTIFYKKKYYEYLKQWGSETIAPVVSDLRGRRFETLLKELYELENEVTLPEGYYPDANYLFINEQDEIIGFLNIRHHLSKMLLNVRGNISYGIKPSHRTIEITEQLLELALIEAKDMGIKRIKFVCDKTDNGLCDHILSIGGSFDSEDYNEVDRHYIQRYWINLE